MSSVARKRYLHLLGADSERSLENRVVSTIMKAVRESRPNQPFPIRLSPVVENFAIVSKPRLTVGSHDGQIEYNRESNQFEITLCTPCPTVSLAQQPGRVRMRFTYAHEVAHRFFFVPHDGGWHRACELATANLNTTEEVKEKLVLDRLEESLCNNIARRVLVPDEELARLDVDEWFTKGIRFKQLLRDTARRFGVSVDCLLVRMQRRSFSSRRAAFLIGKTQGTSLQRCRPRLRVITWIGARDYATGNDMRLHPGAEWDQFGKPATDFINSRVDEDRALSGTLDLPLRTADGSFTNLRGWWSLLNGKNAAGKKMLIWGDLG